jgi:hypothetical protein
MITEREGRRVQNYSHALAALLKNCLILTYIAVAGAVRLASLPTQMTEGNIILGTQEKTTFL